MRKKKKPKEIIITRKEGWSLSYKGECFFQYLIKKIMNENPDPIEDYERVLQESRDRLPELPEDQLLVLYFFKLAYGVTPNLVPTIDLVQEHIREVREQHAQEQN